MSIEFERTGWSRIDISETASDAVALSLEGLGVKAEMLDLRHHVEGHRLHLRLPDYSGDYRIYGGDMIHCLLEKSLEHYLSFVLAETSAGQTAVDVGSCKSVVPEILRRVYGVRCYEHDLEYPAGVQGWRVGSSADDIPLPDASIDFMTLHCTFEHFEGKADIGFVGECARLLKPGGKAIILPLYVNANHCNVTGETDAQVRRTIGFDVDADFYCSVPEWRNRFGRHYSPAALVKRVIAPARAAKLHTRLLRCVACDAIDPRLWLRWSLVLQQPG